MSTRDHEEGGRPLASSNHHLDLDLVVVVDPRTVALPTPSDRTFAAVEGHDHPELEPEPDQELELELDLEPETPPPPRHVVVKTYPFPYARPTTSGLASFRPRLGTIFQAGAGEGVGAGDQQQDDDDDGHRVDDEEEVDRTPAHRGETPRTGRHGRDGIVVVVGAQDDRIVMQRALETPDLLVRARAPAPVPVPPPAPARTTATSHRIASTTNPFRHAMSQQTHERREESSSSSTFFTPTTGRGSSSSSSSSGFDVGAGGPSSGPVMTTYSLATTTSSIDNKLNNRNRSIEVVNPAATLAAARRDGHLQAVAVNTPSPVGFATNFELSRQSHRTPAVHRRPDVTSTVDHQQQGRGEETDQGVEATPRPVVASASAPAPRPRPTAGGLFQGSDMHSFDDLTFDNASQSTPQAVHERQGHHHHHHHQQHNHDDHDARTTRKSLLQDDDDDNDDPSLRSIVTESSLLVASPHLLPPFEMIVPAPTLRQECNNNDEVDDDDDQGPLENLGWLLRPGPDNTPPPWPRGYPRKPTAWDRRYWIDAFATGRLLPGTKWFRLGDGQCCELCQMRYNHNWQIKNLTRPCPGCWIVVPFDFDGTTALVSISGPCAECRLAGGAPCSLVSNGYQPPPAAGLVHTGASVRPVHVPARPPSTTSTSSSAASSSQRSGPSVSASASVSSSSVGVSVSSGGFRRSTSIASASSSASGSVGVVEGGGGDKFAGIVRAAITAWNRHPNSTANHAICVQVYKLIFNEDPEYLQTRRGMQLCEIIRRGEEGDVTRQ